MAEKKNYYEILGVDRNATGDDIKSAYKKLARQYHPDLHPGDQAAAEKFKEINEANSVLSDEQKRKQYDYELDHPGMSGMGGMGGAGFEGFGGFEDIFSSFFGGGMGGADRAQNTRGQDIQQVVELTFLEAALGCTKEVTYWRNDSCKSCNGTGAKGGTEYKKCTKCGGSGKITYKENGIFGMTIRTTGCNACGGTGKNIIEKCPDCKGKGTIRTQTKISIDVPAGADTNSYIKKRGYGMASTNGGQAGDLIIVFKVLPHKMFSRENMDLFVNVPISYKTACLGGKIKVPGINEMHELDIPEGTQSGTVFVLRGRGIHSRFGIGDLKVTVNVEIPVRMDKKEREAIQASEDGVDMRNRPQLKKYAKDCDELYGVDVTK